MESRDRTKEELVEEILQLRTWVSELENQVVEQRTAQEALRESHERFRTVADWTYDWEYLADREGKVAYMSPSCERVTGYQPSEFIGDPALLNRIVHPRSSEAYARHLQWIQGDVERAGEAQEEFRIIARDGSEHWIEHICRPVFTEDGRYLGRRVSNRDITDRKRAEEALRESEERFRSIFEHSPDGILLAAPDGRVFNANPAASRIFGMSQQEICEGGRDGVMDRGDPLWEGLFEERKRSGGARGELNLRRKDGTAFPVSISTSIFTTANGEERTTVIIRDITKRKQAEFALKEKTDALERSNKDLEQFAYVAAHDLREPLVGVAANLQLLKRRTGNVLDEKSRKYLSRALDTTVRMDFLIQSLLAYSKVTADTGEVESTDLNECLAQALSNLKSAVEESGATVTSDYLPILPVRRSQFIRVFQNLIGNAIKFRTTEPLKVHVGFDSSESEYRFSVSDNGQGIAPPYVDRVFELFQRAHESSGLSGTGIGLASCKSIVERHGGRIWVDTARGKGSTFFFTLPRS